LVNIVFLNAQYFGRNKIQDTKEEWSEINTIHFDIYFPKGSVEFGKMISVLAEDTYYYLRDNFNTPLRGRIPLIVYPSQQDFMTTNVITQLLSEGVGGFTESYKNRIVIPFNGSYKDLEDVLTHEMTHAYINALDHQGALKGSYGSTNSRLPFWFTEGLPEFQSLVGEDKYNEMFILDMVMNDKLQSLEQVSGYFAYRQGESFLNFINKEYGRDKVMELFYAFRQQADADEISTELFGMTFHNLELSWKNYLKRQYLPFLTEMKMPYEFSQRLTDHENQGGSRNYGGQISPDGSSYIYFTDRNWRQSVWLGKFYEPEKNNKKIFTGEATGKFEGFNYDKNNLCWFPDGEKFAFVAKTANGDRIYSMNLKGDVLNDIKIEGIESIFELNISADGKQIVFSGATDFQTDLYIYNIDSQELTQITDDIYFNRQPQFSHDGSKIAFVSERVLNPKVRDGYFSGLTNHIYTYDILSKSFEQLTFGEDNYKLPKWIGTGSDSLLVLSDETLSNVYMLDLVNNQKAQLTNVISGVLDYDLSANRSKLLFSNYHDRGWDLYYYDYPLDDLKLEAYQKPVSVAFTNDRASFFNQTRYQEIGKTKRKFGKVALDLRNFKGTIVDFNKDREVENSDSLIFSNNFQVDDVPDSLRVTPTIGDYKVKFRLDNIWGGAGYSSSDGAIGFVQASFSDLMGNHGLGINLGLAGNLDDSSLSLRYLYLPYRLDFGIGVHYLNSESIYRNSNKINEFYRKNEQQTGLSMMTNYPINKFWRLELTNLVYNYKSDWDISFDYEENWEDWESDESDEYDAPSKKDYMIYRPTLSIVHDNSLYGPTGPLMGWRGIYTLQADIGTKEEENITNYFDIRGYKFFNKRYAVAGRVVGGFSRGKGAYEFELDSFQGVRGYYDDDAGRKNKLLASLELRFPFLDYMDIAFPLPIVLGNIRGAVFTDVGAIWGENDYDEGNYSFDAMEDNKLKDIKMGFGFGPRFSMGYLVLKFDFAWDTDLVDCGKPTYFFSIYEEF
jgi:Tol biopolymer transport system component